MTTRWCPSSESDIISSSKRIPLFNIRGMTFEEDPKRVQTDGRAQTLDATSGLVFVSNHPPVYDHGAHSTRSPPASDGNGLSTANNRKTRGRMCQLATMQCV